jgi:NAD(P)-dependent dehydrogenase (short-subunit alcohol dehydrogenase family)
MSDNAIAGRAIICVGAGNGIGRCVAAGLAARGARVAVADIDGAAAEAVAGSLRDAGGTALAVTVDIRDERSVTAMVDRARTELGVINGLYNGAGVAEATAIFHEQTPPVWERVFGINLLGTVNCIRAVAPVMIDGGAGGSIVNVASGAGLRATDPGHAPYVASKHAVVGMTKAAALDYAPYGIRVNAIAPGPTRTDLIVNHLRHNPAAEPHITGRILLGRLAEPEEIAAMALFLFSAEASFCTGAIYEVNGGELAH